MHAQGAAAACQAARDYDPARGVPWGAFVRLRILSSLRTRHRQEWSFAVHCGPDAAVIEEEGEAQTDKSPATDPIDGMLRTALDRLAEPDRRLIQLLFWDGRTETELAAELGVAQSTVNKHKQAILVHLRRSIGDSRTARLS
jgi:RNA polymerase sigma factor (sigma-70 family)